MSDENDSVQDDVDDIVDGAVAESDDSSESDWAAAMAEQSAAEGGDEENYENAQMTELSAEGGGDVESELEHILDIPVTLSVEIGSTKVAIRNLLQLNQGSMVELDRLAGEPLDVLVNGTLVAHGEVVVVNEKFGIRLTDVISARERVRKLQ